MSNHDFAQLRTLDDIARHKKTLHEQVANQKHMLNNDWQHIKRSWQPNSMKSGLSNLLSLVTPSVGVVGMFSLGLKLAKLILSLRRLK